MYKNKLNEWLLNSKISKQLLNELRTLNDEKEIEDRFYKNMEFGTAGIRGVLGAGTNRMNIHTVSQVAEALARKIIIANEQNKGVVIGYDVRHMSKEFAEISAGIFSKHGIKTYLFENIIPTPILSYAVLQLETAHGIMITASHNPKEYNGYKVYANDGTQISNQQAKEIKEHISQVNMFEIENDSINEALSKGNLEYVENELIESYLSKVEKLSINEDSELDKEITVIYSPLNGTGNLYVNEILKRKGYENLFIVEEQKNPDPDFTSVQYPNPEEESAFEISASYGIKHNADILIATDPDADRIGVKVLHDGEYKYLSGNKIGTLLSYYFVNSLKSQSKLNENMTIIKTIVSDNIVNEIAKDFGLKVRDVHVGFKNIYSLSNELEKEANFEYLLGYEESLGFGIGNKIAKDKDAISAALLIVEMTSYYKKLNLTLIDIYNSIQNKYGFHSEMLKSITLPGKDGQEKMESLVESFRKTPINEINNSKLVEKIDYLNDETELEKMNVLKYIYEDGTWFVIRPSGTEPKLKLYIYSVSTDEASSEEKLKNTYDILREEFSGEER